MSANLSGVPAIRVPSSLPPGEDGPALSRLATGQAGALRPVRPAEPIAGATSGTPLSRSGISSELLFGEDADLLVERVPVPRGAVAMGLSQARSALLRHLPTDALAALDDVWAGAEGLEEGWYLRSGALTVLGLPGEGDRVAGEGLARQPMSVALRYLQAIARLSLGDVSPAQAALSEALELAPDSQRLRLVKAVLLSRQGHGEHAREILEGVASEVQDHPAINWARGLLRTSRADEARGQARSTSLLASGGFAAVDEGTAELPTPTARDMAAGRWGSAGKPLLEQSFAAIGAELSWVENSTGSNGESARLDSVRVNTASQSVRALRKLLASGGVLVGSATSGQVHIARGLLSQLLDAINRAPSGVPVGVPVVPTPTHTGNGAALLFAAIAAGNLPRARRLWLRSAASFAPASRPLMEALLGGMAARSGNVEAFDSPAVGSLIVQNGSDHQSLEPIRFGLSLLQEPSDTGPENGLLTRRGITPLGLEGIDLAENGPPVSTSRIVVGRAAGSGSWPIAQGHTAEVPGIRVGEAAGSGWGAAIAAAQATGNAERDAVARSGAPDSGSRALQWVAAVCILLAVVAGLNGYNAVAVAFAVGAAWMGLRRNGRNDHA